MWQGGAQRRALGQAAAAAAEVLMHAQALGLQRDCLHPPADAVCFAAHSKGRAPSEAHLWQCPGDSGKLN